MEILALGTSGVPDWLEGAGVVAPDIVSTTSDLNALEGLGLDIWQAGLILVALRGIPFLGRILNREHLFWTRVRLQKAGLHIPEESEQ